MKPIISEALNKLIKKAKETSHMDAPAGDKKRSFAELNVGSDVAQWLMNLKHGALTKVSLPLDGEDDSDCMLELRLLTAQEEADVEMEMVQLMEKHHIMPLSIAYNIYKISKILSRASKPIASNMKFTSPEMTEEEIRQTLPVEMLIALGEHYNRFRAKHTPNLDDVTEADIEEILAELEKCEQDPKQLFNIFNSLKYFTMLKTAVVIYSKLEDVSSELEKFFTGSSLVNTKND